MAVVEERESSELGEQHLQNGPRLAVEVPVLGLHLAEWPLAQEALQATHRAAVEAEEEGPRHRHPLRNAGALPLTLAVVVAQAGASGPGW